MNHCPGFDEEELFEMNDSFFERRKGFEILKITDMMTHESIMPAGQAKRVFQFPAAGKDHLEGKREFDREGNLASRSPDDIRFAFEDPCHRVVTSHVDLPIVKEEKIRNVPEPDSCFLILIGNGLIAHIAARHDEHFERTVE